MVQPHLRHQITGHEAGGGGASRTNRNPATTALTLSLAEVYPSGPASVGFGYTADRWSPAVTSRSLTAQVSRFGIAGTVIA